MTTLIDTNVLLDTTEQNAKFSQWSRSHLNDAIVSGSCVVNTVVLAEFSTGFARTENAEEILGMLGIGFSETTASAGYRAGEAYRVYRNRGGTRQRTLPDFLIGAHAAVAGFKLLSRDASVYRSYFPEVELITMDDPA